MVLGRNVEQDETMCCVKKDDCAFLTFCVISLCYDSDKPLILCLLCKSKTLWNIFVILGRNVEQDHTTCHVQE